MGIGTTCCCDTVVEQQGACCFSDGSCTQVTKSECTSAGGFAWHGGKECSEVQCSLDDQACCLPDGTCEDTSAQRCLALGGSPQGEGSLCASTECEGNEPTGACCLLDGTCVDDQTQAECNAQSGVWQGSGVLCANVFCPAECEECTEGQPPNPMKVDVAATLRDSFYNFGDLAVDALNAVATLPTFSDCHNQRIWNWQRTHPIFGDPVFIRLKLTAGPTANQGMEMEAVYNETVSGSLSNFHIWTLRFEADLFSPMACHEHQGPVFEVELSVDSPGGVVTVEDRPFDIDSGEINLP